MAVRIDENIRWFQVTMDNLRRVQILHALANLIHDESVVNILQYLLTDSVMEIGLHELKNKIKIFVIISSDNIEKLDDIRVG